MKAMDAIEGALAPKVDRQTLLKLREIRKFGPEPSEATENKKSLAAGSVSRILSARLLLRDGHSSGPCITARL
jgi:hypothetical protein